MNLYDGLPTAIAGRPDFVNGGYDGRMHDNTFYISPNQAREAEENIIGVP